MFVALAAVAAGGPTGGFPLACPLPLGIAPLTPPPPLLLLPLPRLPPLLLPRPVPLPPPLPDGRAVGTTNDNIDPPPPTPTPEGGRWPVTAPPGASPCPGASVWA